MKSKTNIKRGGKNIYHIGRNNLRLYFHIKHYMLGRGGLITEIGEAPRSNGTQKTTGVLGVFSRRALMFTCTL